MSKSALDYFTKDLAVGKTILNLETGRYNNQPGNERVCACCTMQCRENEYHFTLIYPALCYISYIV